LPFTFGKDDCIITPGERLDIFCQRNALNL
jgi:hypothetical protein